MTLEAYYATDTWTWLNYMGASDHVAQPSSTTNVGPICWFYSCSILCWPSHSPHSISILPLHSPHSLASFSDREKQWRWLNWNHAYNTIFVSHACSILVVLLFLHSSFTYGGWRFILIGIHVNYLHIWLVLSQIFNWVHKRFHHHNTLKGLIDLYV